MRVNQPIQIKVGNVTVEGIITWRTASDIGVIITNPYVTLNTGRHIAYFARPYSSYEGEHGDKTAHDLLEGLYAMGKHLDDNLASLREAYDQLQAKSVLLTKELKAVIREMKQLLKRISDDDISVTLFCKAWRSLRKKRKELESAICESHYEFNNTHFPEPLRNRANDAEVRDILEGNRPLLASEQTSQAVGARAARNQGAAAARSKAKG